MNHVRIDDQSRKNRVARKLSGRSQLDNLPVGGLQVRSGVRAGAWWCNSCAGTTEGSQLINPTCGYCQAY